MSEIALGLVGVGYWGSKLARNIHEAHGCRLAGLCDADLVRLESSVERYPGATPFPNLETLLESPDIDGVVLATPASLHAEHARQALDAGKHVLVEKPLALSLAECDDLVERSESSGLTLMVGHTFVYSEPVRYLRAQVQAGELGQVLYVYSHRLNLGVIREDLNALWNFGPHDVSILLYLFEQMPVRVSALQYSLLNRDLEDVAFCVLEYADGLVAHIHESWLDPRKIRQLTIVGDRRMAVYDDTDVETPIRMYDKGVALPDGGIAPFGEIGFGEFKLETRSGDMLAPRIPGREPLRVEIEHFASCIAEGKQPDTGARHGRDVVAILATAERSAKLGRPVELHEIREPISS